MTAAVDRSLLRLRLGQAQRRFAEAGIPTFLAAPGDKPPLFAKCRDAGDLTGDELEAHASACGRDGHGVYDATCDLDRIGRWRLQHPDANLAMRCTRIVVVDLNGEAGPESFKALQRRYGPVPETLWTCTPSGGWHAWFQHPGDGEIGNSSGSLGEGIDVRGCRGYVVCPPSTCDAGSWRWHNPDIEAAPLPGWLLRLVRPPELPRQVEPLKVNGNVGPYVRAALRGEIANVAAASKGTRHFTLNRSAFCLGQLVGARLLEEQVAIQALANAAQACGLPEAEYERTIRDGLRAGAAHPREVAR